MPSKLVARSIVDHNRYFGLLLFLTLTFHQVV